MNGWRSPGLPPEPERQAAARKPPKNRWGCGILVLPLALAAGYAFINAKHWHPSEESHPLQGIDVSHHQGQIDWSVLPGQGVDFAWIKATEGGDWTDPRFAENWEGAGLAGIRRGAYHFFTLCRSGADQAANFVATVPADADALPPAVDLEFLGNCSDRPAIEDVAGELADFLALVEEHAGQPAILYLTEEFDEAYQVSAQVDRPLWLRSMVLEPDFGARDWTVWQVSNFRMVQGIDGRVDWNVMREGAQ